MEYDATLMSRHAARIKHIRARRLTGIEYLEL
jgi:hypothetical protein